MTGQYEVTLTLIILSASAGTASLPPENAGQTHK